MGCLNDIICGKRTIIGIRDFDGCVAPESGLHLNDIPGITLRNASAIADAEKISGVNLLKSQINRATRLVFNEFQNRISMYYNFNAIVETRLTNNFSANINNPIAKEQGLIIKRWRSEVARIYIETLFIKTNTSGSGTVKIIDGVTITTHSITVEAGKVFELRVDYVANSEQVKIVMDNASWYVFTGNITENPDQCGGCGSYSYDVQGLIVRGWNGDSEENNYFGIGVMCSVRCYEENILCSLLPRMYFILWYRCAVEYFDDLVSGNGRLNAVTIFNKEQAALDLVKYTDKYDKAFEEFIPTIRKFLSSTKGECITCNTDKNVQSHS